MITNVFGLIRCQMRGKHVVGHLKNGVTEPVLARAFEYWRKIDQSVGDRIARPKTPRMRRGSHVKIKGEIAAGPLQSPSPRYTPRQGKMRWKSPFV
jgi:hypothetical protein